MSTRTLLVILALAMTVISPLAAQEAKSPSPKAETKPEGFKPNLSGFLQVDYRRGDDANQPTAVAHEFAIRRARLTASGKAQEKISYVVTLQLESSTAAVLDAFAEYSVNPMVRVRAGQYKYDFDLIGRESAPALALIDRPFITNVVAGSLSGASTASAPAASFRDRGVAVMGDKTTANVNWGYSFGVFQGAGRASDNNDAFGYAANLRVYPLKPLRLNAGLLSSDAAAKGAPQSLQYDAWTAGVSYEHKLAAVAAEYYRATRDRGAIVEGVSGLYVSATYSPASQIDLTARYQYMEDERFAAGNDAAKSVDLGVRWYFARKGARAGNHLSLNYMSRSADDGFADLTLLNDGRGASLKNGGLAKGVAALRFQVQF